jgi:uncharacterized protein (DUF983 family)
MTGPSPEQNTPAPSLAQATLSGLCPRCGKGRLFSGVLAINKTCPVCGLNLSAADTGDAFAVPILIVVGAIVVGAAFWIDFHYEPPLWVHVLIWPPVTAALVVVCTRYLKAFFAVQQYRTRSSEMGL